MELTFSMNKDKDGLTRGVGVFQFPDVLKIWGRTTPECTARVK